MVTTETHNLLNRFYLLLSTSLSATAFWGRSCSIARAILYSWTRADLFEKNPQCKSPGNCLFKFQQLWDWNWNNYPPLCIKCCLCLSPREEVGFITLLTFSSFSAAFGARLIMERVDFNCFGSFYFNNLIWDH